MHFVHQIPDPNELVEEKLEQAFHDFKSVEGFLEKYDAIAWRYALGFCLGSNHAKKYCQSPEQGVGERNLPEIGPSVSVQN